MGSKASFVSMVILIIILAGSVFGAGVFIAHLYFTYSFLLVSVGVVCAYQLVNRYRRTNRDIAFFFDAVRNNDSTSHYPTSIKNKSLLQLHESMNRLNSHIQQLKLRNAYKEKYYKALIQQSNTGLAVLKEDNSMELLNETTCRYAGISPESTNMNLLKIKNEAFYKVLCALEPGETITYKNVLNGTIQLLLFRATQIRDGQSALKLVSIQDIKQELDEKELESYQKLISILTHEMMNSIAPLTSISKTLFGFFIKNGTSVKPSELNETIVTTTIQGLKAIEEQGNGLMSFVNNYRKLTKVPQPVLQMFDIRDWMEQLSLLYAEKFEANQIAFECKIEEQAKEVIGDKNLINQVLVNLINNAIDALTKIEGIRKIQMNISKTREGRLLIKLANNGPLIPEELQEKIFIPFFTTRENGSGIGLSLSRQIMRLHKGSLNVISNEMEGTVFLLEV